MEDMLKQLIAELKRLNDTAQRIEERLKNKKQECGGQALEEVGRHLEETDGSENESVYMSASGDLEYIWRRVLDIIKREIVEVSYKTWLETIKPLSIDKDVIRLGVLSEFEKSIIECRYIGLIKTALKSIMNSDFELELSVISSEGREAVLNKGITIGTDKNHSSFNLRYSFDTFVVGKHNESAYKHVFKIAENPYNHNKLLYIYGEVGTGKTHLIQAAGNYISEHHPDARIRYLSIEEFTNEMIEAIRYDDSVGFREKLSGYDVLLIDDLQFIAGKEATQKEFFKIVSELLERGKLVIIVSTESPQNIKIMNERFTSMFELGGVFEVERPDLDTKLNILRRRRDEENFELSDEELGKIADSTSGNVRELLNAFNRFITQLE